MNTIIYSIFKNKISFIKIFKRLILVFCLLILFLPILLKMWSLCLFISTRILSNETYCLCDDVTEIDMQGSWLIEDPMFYLAGKGNEEKKGWKNIRLTLNADLSFSLVNINEDLWERIDLYGQSLSGKKIKRPLSIFGSWKIVHAKFHTDNGMKNYCCLSLKTDIDEIMNGRKLILKINDDFKINWQERGDDISQRGLIWVKIEM